MSRRIREEDIPVDEWQSIRILDCQDRTRLAFRIDEQGLALEGKFLAALVDKAAVEN